MTHGITTGIAGLLLAGAAGVIDPPQVDPRAVYGPDEHIFVPADEIDWRAGPEALPGGVEHAVLEGDPGEAGMFVMRLKLPDGYEIPPHTHPGVERVTVLSGTFRVGKGHRFDAEQTDALTAGGFTVMPAGMQHYAVAEGETVIQITTVGPWDIHYDNPRDDPRLSE